MNSCLFYCNIFLTELLSSLFLVLLLSSDMTAQFILAGILMIGVLAYLVYAVLYPEKF